jgi:hypothetical protein
MEGERKNKTQKKDSFFNYLFSLLLPDNFIIAKLKPRTHKICLQQNFKKREPQE